MPSASLNEVNFSSQSPNNKFRKVGHRSSTGAQTPGCHPHRQRVLAHSTNPFHVPRLLGSPSNAVFCPASAKVQVRHSAVNEALQTAENAQLHG